MRFLTYILSNFTELPFLLFHMVFKKNSGGFLSEISWFCSPPQILSGLSLCLVFIILTLFNFYSIPSGFFSVGTLEGSPDRSVWRYAGTKLLSSLCSIWWTCCTYPLLERAKPLPTAVPIFKLAHHVFP